jgi:hypothetical protein
MSRLTSSLLLGAVLAVGTAHEAGAHHKTAHKQLSQPIDPAAMAALQRMGAYLRNQQNFTVHTKMETDYVVDPNPNLLEAGLKVRLQSQGEIEVERPGKLHASMTSDRKDREFFYDGKSFTVYSPRSGYYATVDAPPRIGDLADTLEKPPRLRRAPSARSR